MATKTKTAVVEKKPVKLVSENRLDRKNLDMRAGDTVRVHQRIQDQAGKVRTQIFEGMVLARKHGTEAGATFTVRKVASGVGVEKIYPLYSPNVEKIEVTKRSKTRRAKLYFVREKAVKEMNKRMKMEMMKPVAVEKTETAAPEVAPTE